MKHNLPYISLAQLPTPFYRLDNISAELKRNIYIKRDDMTGVSLGGNKVRKLGRKGKGLRYRDDHGRRAIQPRHAHCGMLPQAWH